MMTKIFHPNVSKSGEICVDTLKKAWKKEYGVGHVLVVCRRLSVFSSFSPFSTLLHDLHHDSLHRCRVAKR